MLTFRSAALTQSGTPIHIAFSSDNLVKTLKAHNISNYKEYELFLKLPDNKEQLMLSVERGAVTYGTEIYRQVCGSPAAQLALPWDKTEMLIPTDKTANHRKVKLTKEPICG